MAARDVEFVELYTADAKATVNHYADAFGFTPVAKAIGPGTETLLLRQGTVQIAVTAGPALAAYLDVHGDGIADIALSCDDAEATWHSAIAAGARPVTVGAGLRAVSGFGDVRHTLLPAGRPNGPRRLPPGRDWIAVTSRTPSADAAHIAGLDHVAACLEAGSLEDYVRLYIDGFGMHRYSGEYVSFADQAMDSVVVRSAGGGATFTLIEPDRKKQAGQIDAFLDGNSGPGVQHLAFLVDEIVAAVAELGERGVNFLSTPATYYDLLLGRFPDLADQVGRLRAANVLVDRDEWGELLQIFTRSPFARNTLFSELIQRRGSRGFGANNIKALYEAVEFDRAAAARG